MGMMNKETWWEPIMKEMNKYMDQIKDNLHDIKEKIDKLEVKNESY